ncbi:maker331 [Drosophila busckii]|uniref:Maker331 n=1 Tax=Drosophila busckii TaxID=30019 RepID=A0A0M4EZ28_DROBS|nr:maker331 [Drosophila busckii]
MDQQQQRKDKIALYKAKKLEEAKKARQNRVGKEEKNGGIISSLAAMEQQRKDKIALYKKKMAEAKKGRPRVPLVDTLPDLFLRKPTHPSRVATSKRLASENDARGSSPKRLAGYEILKQDETDKEMEMAMSAMGVGCSLGITFSPKRKRVDNNNNDNNNNNTDNRPFVEKMLQPLPRDERETVPIPRQSSDYDYIKIQPRGIRISACGSSSRLHSSSDDDDDDADDVDDAQAELNKYNVH